MPSRTTVLTDILDVLYGVAANPEAWEDLVDVLPLDAQLTEPLAEVEADLDRSVRIARNVASRASGQPASPLAAHIELTLRLEIVAMNSLARQSLGAAAQKAGERLALKDDATEVAFRRAMSAIAASGEPVLLTWDLMSGSGPTVARLSPSADGYGLTFIPPKRTVGDLNRWLGLSPAESRLANALRRNGTLADAAAALGVSANTARNQLASIFSKLGISRQGDLSRILAELSAVTAPGLERQPPPPAPEHRTLILPDGRRLSYREYGQPSGAPVLAFHEGMGSSLLPPETQNIARRLGLRLVVADRPGFGQSDRLPVHSFERVAEDMQALCDVLSLKHIVILGLLSGATPAFGAAARLGDRVRRVLILSGRPPVVASSAPLTPLTAFRARLERHSWLRPTIFRLLRTRVSPVFIARMFSRAARSSPGDRAFLEQRPDVESFVSAYVIEALAGDGVGPSDELAASQNTPNFQLTDIAAPITIFHGAEDQLSPLEDLRRYLGQHPYKLKLYPDIGQFMALKHWEDILEAAV